MSSRDPNSKVVGDLQRSGIKFGHEEKITWWISFFVKEDEASGDFFFQEKNGTCLFLPGRKNQWNNLPVRTFNSEFFNDPAKKGGGKEKRQNRFGSKKGLSFSSPSCGGEEIWEAVSLGKLFLVMEFVLVYTKWVQKLTVR